MSFPFSDGILWDMTSNQGKLRKEQAGYVEGVDSLGRKSWRKAELDVGARDLLKMLQKQGVKEAVIDASMDAYLDSVNSEDFQTPMGMWSNLDQWDRQTMMQKMNSGVWKNLPEDVTQKVLWGVFDNETESHYRAQALDSASASVEMLMEGVKTGNSDMVSAALRNKNATTEMFWAALDDVEQGITDVGALQRGVRYARTTLDPELQEELLGSVAGIGRSVVGTRGVTQNVYNRFHLDTLDRLDHLESQVKEDPNLEKSSEWRETSADVQALIASPRADVEFVNDMALSWNGDFKFTALASPKTTEETMMKVLEESDTDWDAARRVMTDNPETSAKVLTKILQGMTYKSSLDRYVNEILKHENVTGDVIEEVWKGGAQSKALITHTKTPESVIRSAADSEDQYMRRAAAQAPSASTETLGVLLDDDDMEVRRYARKNCYTQGYLPTPPPIEDISVGKKSDFKPENAHGKTYEVRANGELKGYVSGEKDYWEIYDVDGKSVQFEGNRELGYNSRNDPYKEAARKTAAYELVAPGY